MEWRSGGSGPPRQLFQFSALLLAQSLPRKRFFGPALLAGFHVETVLLDFLDDIFLLHLALKTAQCIFQRFILLDNYFSHVINSPPIRFGLVSCGASCEPYSGRLCESVGTAPVLHYRTYWAIYLLSVKGRRHLVVSSVDQVKDSLRQAGAEEGTTTS